MAEKEDVAELIKRCTVFAKVSPDHFQAATVFDKASSCALLPQQLMCL